MAARALLILIGIATSFNFSAIGLVFYGEIAMAVVAPWIILHKCGDRGFWNRPLFLCLVCLTVTMASYVVSDLINQTGLDNVVRGWGRLLFIYTDILFLYGFCYGAPINLSFFCLGMGIGDFIMALLNERPGYTWKFGYGVPVTMLAVLWLCANRRRISPSLGAGVLVGLAAIHMALDFRSFSALCLILALVLMHMNSPQRSWARFGLLPLTLVVLIGVGGVYYLYRNSEQLYDTRRHDSNAYRKSGIVTALTAISQSPIVGFGSWAYNPELQWVFQQSISDEGSRLTARYEAHSQILQAWYEGGIFATFFLVYLGFGIGRGCFYIIRCRPPDSLTLVYSLFLFISSWDLFMSPFAGYLRLRISITAVVILLLRAEQETARARAWRANHANTQLVHYSTVGGKALV
jgi:hypothetical protein